MDRGLVERAQAGDRTAFATIVAASVGALDRVARLITRDPEQAKDAVQEALIKAWRALPSLRDPERFDAWLRQLLLRSCIDAGRPANATRESGGQGRGGSSVATSTTWMVQAREMGSGPDQA